jgi:hypothetical protein
MTLTETTSLAGLLFGLSGFLLGVMNYLRDRPKIVVTLQWGLIVTPGGMYDSDKQWGAIRVTNVGRRATYVSHAVLRLPKGREYSHLMIHDSIQGKKLSEGDATVIYMVSQDNLAQYAAGWRQIVAQVSDTTGKVWTSKRLKGTEKPSWASAH